MGTLSLPRKVSVLGSTGSIGVSTLDLFDQAGVEVEMVGLVAGRNVARLAEQALRWRPQLAVIEDEALLPELRERLKGSGIATAAGAQAVSDVASADAQWVMSAIVGFAGLAPTLAAAKAGAVIALANKESLVCAGPSLLRTAKLAGGAVVPVDSEHSAIFQVLDPQAAAHVSRLILTSSGGPFRDASREDMAKATLEQALAHPNFSMGAKISIDSATMMNKGLEVIEAAYLFSMPPERIEVLVHPQQIIHSLVEYADGSTLAQLGPPDMRPPIACAFAWPDRLPWPAPKLDLVTAGPLTFQHPDPKKFPALSIAKQALTAGGQAPAAMNAANERAVSAFLDRRIRFLDIPNVVAETLERMDRSQTFSTANDAVESARETDAAARRTADEVVSGLFAA
ncbi:MAG: 1-deoxy-D-xylulose-5-phosphate reductoisomerase [Phenylobacterium sp. RIFCSPHIGHO2_01_FULL_69_31]|uniref:1-deoxy-D-xylulose-5-phosphate reductoisomerase n=1 Tax=Phenylobacterium sp. RIFCSPHIGHO2_01_FULL_69_31 TaxID=1801944 RepID=UPI0008B37040|nr:1-deoxy-D-xylulose-5-phosphate reductoisomerase [Phenylobacterium sp. RIFCSPHIGHO2_01_FULL_69_31]OHB28061.1 MAG: 1-deoxy-D-xylulose-5-phosphate reductoisomerase [Phenylobacterium sp. RIFCSPHIGHO2_01_FULL_69_31]